MTCLCCMTTLLCVWACRHAGMGRWWQQSDSKYMQSVFGGWLQVACKKAWPQQLQCWTLVLRSLCLKIFSTHLNDASI